LRIKSENKRIYNQYKFIRFCWNAFWIAISVSLFLFITDSAAADSDYLKKSKEQNLKINKYENIKYY
jgi:hypothetical protein